MRTIPAVLLTALVAGPALAQTDPARLGMPPTAAEQAGTEQADPEGSGFPRIGGSHTYVTHTIEARFGMGYSSTSDRAQPLYEGRYTASFNHMADNGLRIRFDLGVAFGNFDSSTPPIHRLY